MKMDFKAIPESLLSTVNNIGSIIFTDEKNLYIIRNNLSKMKITDVIFIDSINNIELTKTKNKLYIDTSTWLVYIVNNNEFTLLTKNQSTLNIPIIDTQSTINYEYNTNGTIKKATYSGGINKTIEYIYNLDNTLQKEIHTGNDGISKTRTYTYDNNRNILSITDDGTNSIKIQ